MARRWRNVLTLVFAALLAWAASGYGYLEFRRTGLGGRYVPLSRAEFDALGNRPFAQPADSLFFRSIAEAAGMLPADSVERSALRAIGWLMNEVARAGDGYGGVGARTRDQLAFARAGGGLNCSQMSAIADRLFRSVGIPSRVVTLLGDPSPRALWRPTALHATVEVRVGGRWEVFDPTFHVSFMRSGMRLGTSEVADAVFQGEAAAVRPHFYGEVRYPSRLEAQAVPWPDYFGAPMVAWQHPPALWAKLPVVRYWAGGTLYYLDGEHASGLRTLDRLYFLVTVILPLLGGILLVAAAGAAYRVRGRPAVEG